MSQSTVHRQRTSLSRTTLVGSSILLAILLVGNTSSVDAATFQNGQVIQSSAQTSSIARGDDYPNYLKYAAPDAVIDPWRLYNRECTSFVAWRLSSVNGFTLPPAYGNADVWGPRASREGYVVNKTPALGSVAWWSSCHVAWVSAIKGDSVEIEEYNYGYNHAYHRRIVKINDVDGFIHFRDVKSAGVTPVSANPSGLASSGSYTFKTRTYIRSEARLSSPEVAYYEAGQSVNYDRIVEADGYCWLSYISYSGVRRYLAIEPLRA